MATGRSSPALAVASWFAAPMPRLGCKRSSTPRAVPRKRGTPHMYAPWAKHYQSAWDNHAANTELPLWTLVVCLAHGRHEANGPAGFQRGDLSWILGKPSKIGGDFKRRDRQRSETLSLSPSGTAYWPKGRARNVWWYRVMRLRDRWVIRTSHARYTNARRRRNLPPKGRFAGGWYPPWGR
jgi:hypothetical protein